ncbi:MAG: Hint domain-containing protein [Roseobacter sp.]
MLMSTGFVLAEMLGSKTTERLFGSSEVLGAAKKLLPHEGISVVDDTSDRVVCFHLLFENHQVVYSDGMPTKSLFIGTETKKAPPPEAKAEIR